MLHHLSTVSPRVAFAHPTRVYGGGSILSEKILFQWAHSKQRLVPLSSSALFSSDSSASTSTSSPSVKGKELRKVKKSEDYRKLKDLLGKFKAHKNKDGNTGGGGKNSKKRNNKDNERSIRSFKTPEGSFFHYRHTVESTTQRPRSANVLRASPATPIGFEAVAAPLEEEVVCGDFSQVPTIKHGLNRVIHTGGIHLFREGKRFNFPKELQPIHKPSEVALHRIPPFITTSRDVNLHKYALQHDSSFKGSTSSVTGIITQLYLLLSRYRPPVLSCLGPDFAGSTDRWARSTTKPTVVMMRKRDGVFSLDGEAGTRLQSNGLLLSLGKSLERRLTMEVDDFERSLVTTNGDDSILNETEVYHVMKKGKLMLRSQLDCKDMEIRGERKTFDLKTRATLQIRRSSMLEDSLPVSVRDLRVGGYDHSYAREYYDLLRSVLIKYNFQCRIGHMNGAFVAYHNARELLAFEYLTIEEMNRCIFGNTPTADAVYEVCFEQLEMLLERCTNDLSPQCEAARLVVWTDKTRGKLIVFTEEIPNDDGWKELQFAPSPTKTKSSFSYDIRGKIRHYTLSNKIFVDGVHYSNKWLVNNSDEKLHVFQQFEEVTTHFPANELVKMYANMLERTGLWDHYQS